MADLSSLDAVLEVENTHMVRSFRHILRCYASNWHRCFQHLGCVSHVFHIEVPRCERLTRTQNYTLHVPGNIYVHNSIDVAGSLATSQNRSLNSNLTRSCDILFGDFFSIVHANIFHLRDCVLDVQWHWNRNNIFPAHRLRNNFLSNN